MQSFNGGQAATVRARGSGPDGVAVAIFAGEYLIATDRGRRPEDIGKVAIDQPNGCPSDAVVLQMPQLDKPGSMRRTTVKGYKLRRIWTDHR